LLAIVASSSVLVTGSNNEHIVEILCCSTNQRYAPNINLLDNIDLTQTFLQRRGLSSTVSSNGYKSTITKSNGGNIVLSPACLHITRIFSSVQDASENSRMKCLYPASKNGRITRKLFNGSNGVA
jgi:hypothetical protein